MGTFFQEDHSDRNQGVCCECFHLVDMSQNDEGLRAHILSSHKHTKDAETFMCTQCARKFKFRWRLEEHVAATHSTEANTFLCQSCPKTFPTKKTLDYHVHVTHSQGKIYCSRCDKSFSHAKFLVIHVMQHIRIKAQYCKICGYKAVHRKHVALHITRTHHKKAEDADMGRDEALYQELIGQARAETKAMKLASAAVNS